MSSQPHNIKGTIVECKLAFPKEFNKQYLRNKINQNVFKNKNKFSIHRKLFVGGLPPTVDKNMLRSFFQKYGEVEYSIVMTEKATDKPRGMYIYKVFNVFRFWIYCV